MNCDEQFMHARATITYILLYLILQSLSRFTKAGVCWETINDATGTCRKAFNANMSRDDCCAIGGGASISWTAHSRSSEIFFLNFLSHEGAPGCQRCHKSCDSVTCISGRVCRMVDGFPQCVCRPRCNRSVKIRGPVCGTDGRKYKNYCALLRRNCKEHRTTEVEYFGRCRRSCKHVRCSQGKHCLEDQNGHPHCWTCNTTCTHYIQDNPRNYFCGVDGRTYKNTCELRAEICRVGHSITFAYNGACRENATCLTTTCPGRSTCLSNPDNGQPVCADCFAIGVHCPSTTHVPVCGTDGRTYPSFCLLRRSSCQRGIFVTSKKAGRCKRKKKTNKSNRINNAKRIKSKERKRKRKITMKKRKQRQREMKRKKQKAIHTRHLGRKRIMKDKMARRLHTTYAGNHPDDIHRKSTHSTSHENNSS